MKNQNLVGRWVKFEHPEDCEAKGIVRAISWLRGGESCRFLVEAQDGNFHMLGYTSVQALAGMNEVPVSRAWESLLGRACEIVAAWRKGALLSGQMERLEAATREVRHNLRTRDGKE